ncbi:MAG: TraB/GumN family protein [Burkholderiales bacterium]|nr:TraB/GumN family protein [Burkholderiales bacterium]
MALVRFVRSALAVLLLFAAGLAAARDSCPPPAPAPGTLSQQQLQADVRDRGFLWRLTRDGRTSWLYGTIHVSRPEWLLPGERVQAALAASDVLALELDPADPELARVFSAPADAARAQRVLAGLGPRIARVAAHECVPAAALAALPPLLQVSTLGLAETRRDGFHPELAIDVMLWGRARALGKPVVALETPASQLAALVPASEAEEHELLVEGLDEIESGSDRQATLKLLQAWADSDGHALATYADWCHCMDTEEERRYLRTLNDGRNGPMAGKLAALAASGRTFFAAVGSLHMTGPQALTELLRARGFAVERVPFPSRRDQP